VEATEEGNKERREQPMTPSYSFKIDAQWSGGRRGIAESESEIPGIHFSAPPQFQGESGFWTPEHFLVAAAASCFVTTFCAIAEISKFEVLGLKVSAEGIIEKGEGGFQFTRITLRPELTVARKADQERGVRLLEKAERSCLISRSLKNQVVVDPLVQVAAPAMAG
jgi:peroxiredoxin-like protein